MIYSSTVNSINESEIEELLENAENRFEYETVAEATAIIVAEQEQNWTRFMTGVGLAELSSVMEGQEVIYEGARLKSFLAKAKAYFKMALNKLAEITKSFIAKVESLIRSNDSFVKKYGSKITSSTLPDDFSMKGYTFEGLDNKKPDYDLSPIPFDSSKLVNATKIIGDKDKYSREAAEKKLLTSYNGDGSFTDALTEHFFGSKEKIELKKGNIGLKGQVDILSNTKTLKSNAKKSYTDAAKGIKKIISDLEKAEKSALKDNTGSDGNVEKASSVDSAYNIIISYWKSYSNAASQTHGMYMRALSARAHQAKAICAKALGASFKSEGKDKRNTYRKSAGMSVKEGFVNTDAFLGAVEFI